MLLLSRPRRRTSWRVWLSDYFAPLRDYLSPVAGSEALCRRPGLDRPFGDCLGRTAAVEEMPSGILPRKGCLIVILPLHCSRRMCGQRPEIEVRAA
jgi:hypothetical protein